ncbi:DUF2069 domain-containing protein [Niveibacterium sp. 24ML]|uniref:DUF2069 domain-containing protein n=1 Tax=Niveibacterium sp. 24ML TaxID=2985512 RepID=UPI002271F449|nr:DUF2069 domain-containing protein [Niveibacterium sp. 24ML]MCX9157611.1 DUF2069 domain-containing protein [Niveibacterium sp. 24ML]
MTPKLLQRTAVTLLLALITLCLAWELWLAPLRPGGSWLALKVLPLLAPLRGLLHGKRYTFQWTTLMIWLYFTEGVVRATSDRAPSSTLALVETLLALALFAVCALYARNTAPSRMTAQ